MKLSFYQMVVAIVIITVTGTFLMTVGNAGWDSATEHIVTVDVYDMYGAYCGSYGYSYYVPDTTTQHYKYYHAGPTVPNTHQYPHSATLTGRYQHVVDEDLETYCDGTHPNDYYDVASGS